LSLEKLKNATFKLLVFARTLLSVWNATFLLEH